MFGVDDPLPFIYARLLSCTHAQHAEILLMLVLTSAVTPTTSESQKNPRASRWQSEWIGYYNYTIAI